MLGAHECLVNQQYKICIFMLHQALEQSCIVLIRVQIAYRSEFHNLHRLLYLCNSFSNLPGKIFLSNSPEDERLFDVLVKSYSGARYGDHFSVEQGDAHLLYKKIASFVTLAKQMCEEKIVKLENEAALYKQVTQEREVQNG
ncbi:HEPN domain-containing protein [Pedobacter sp. PAMC26386]|nr:HEPN domain-containing protein [Pedobacter sp. PAMC26386]